MVSKWSLLLLTSSRSRVDKETSTPFATNSSLVRTSTQVVTKSSPLLSSTRTWPQSNTQVLCLVKSTLSQFPRTLSTQCWTPTCSNSVSQQLNTTVLCMVLSMPTGLTTGWECPASTSGDTRSTLLSRDSLLSCSTKRSITSETSTTRLWWPSINNSALLAQLELTLVCLELSAA